MTTDRKFILQRRDTPGSGEWTDAGVAMGELVWARAALENFTECVSDSEFRIVEQTVITICKPVNL